MRKCASVGDVLNPVVCSRVESLSGCVVTRRDLRPKDWSQIWPELDATAPAAQPVGEAQQVK